MHWSAYQILKYLIRLIFERMSTHDLTEGTVLCGGVCHPNRVTPLLSDLFLATAQCGVTWKLFIESVTLATPASLASLPPHLSTSSSPWPPGLRACSSPYLPGLPSSLPPFLPACLQAWAPETIISETREPLSKLFLELCFPWCLTHVWWLIMWPDRYTSKCICTISTLYEQVITYINKF